MNFKNIVWFIKAISHFVLLRSLIIINPITIAIAIVIVIVIVIDIVIKAELRIILTG